MKLIHTDHFKWKSALYLTFSYLQVNSVLKLKQILREVN